MNDRGNSFSDEFRQMGQFRQACQQADECRPVDTGALARRLDQLERRVDDLSSGVARREPIVAGPIETTRMIVVQKRLAPGLGGVYQMVVPEGALPLFIADGWRHPNA